MTEEGHRAAVEELREQRARLDRIAGIRAYTELSFGMAHHLGGVGGQRRFGVHQDNHEGLARWLRDRGASDIADMFAELEQMRIGRWYGRQANGDAAKHQDELLDAIAAWALA